MDDIKFLKLIGLAANERFQKCVAYVEHIYKKYPRKFGKPYIRQMFEVDWREYLVKTQRKLGGQLWCLEKPFVVFVNDEFLGDDEDLLNFLYQYKITVNLRGDYSFLSRLAVFNLYEKEFKTGRKFVYFSIAINKEVIGQLIFLLYTDLVPKTCGRFIKLCTSNHGYRGKKIHRIVKNSWIQFGGYSLGTKSKSCENYVVPHNRRGVLSMCNNGPHKDNTTQFFVTLDSTPWMNYRYVAFGQLVQGESLLRKLEHWSTHLEYPNPDKLRIADCGEISFDENADVKLKDKIDLFLNTNTIDDDVLDLREVPSIMLEKKYFGGQYWFEQDDKSRLPLDNLPSYLMTSDLESWFSRYSQEYGEPQEYEDEMSFHSSTYGEFQESETDKSQISSYTSTKGSYGESQINKDDGDQIISYLNTYRESQENEEEEENTISVII